jgi:hypothetical protein
MARRRGSGRGLQGARRVKKLLRRLPDEARGAILKGMQAEAPVIEGFMRAQAPARSGKLRRLLRVRVLPRSLRMQIGLIGRAANREAFYGRILELGRKAQTVRRKRGGKVHMMRVRAISAGRYDFVYGRAREFFLRRMQQRLGSVWEDALRRAAEGLNDV